MTMRSRFVARILSRGAGAVLAVLVASTTLGALGAPAVEAGLGDGRVWGDNQFGQLGDGTTIAQTQPVAGPSGSLDLAGGRHHVVSVAADGTVTAWGWNGFGQIGDATVIDRLIETTVPGVRGASAVGAGHYHSLAVVDGAVWAWGRNATEQLGQAARWAQPEPVEVVGVDSAVMVAGGREHSMALLADGSVATWGGNRVGQLGDGTLEQRAAPAVVVGLDDVTHISAGRIHSLALRADGTVWTWGDNTYGQLGDGTITSRSTPVQVTGLSDVVRVEAFGFHSVALTADGTVWAWGRNNLGQLGDGTETQRTSPVRTDVPPAISIGSGRDYAMAATADGTVWTWGRNDLGQLGDGTFVDRTTPVAVEIGELVEELVGGRDYVAARLGGDVAPPPPPAGPICVADVIGSDLHFAWSDGLGRAVLRRAGRWFATPGEVTEYVASGRAADPGPWLVRLRADGMVRDVECVVQGEPPPAGPSCTLTVIGADAVLEWDGDLPSVNLRRNGSWLATPPDGATSWTVSGGAGDTYVVRSRDAGVRTDHACE